MADLTYNIVEMNLTGAIDGVSINARAFSGGRAGSKQKGAVHPIKANNPFATGIKLDKSTDTSGGPLPMGQYSLRTHESRKNWIRLIPDSGNAMHGRDGFAIHGRGSRGSDGCVVPEDFNCVLQIHSLLKAREKASLSPPTLEVIATGDIDGILQNMSRWNSIA